MALIKSRALITIAVAFTFSAAVLAEVDFVNGPWYWKWPWRDLSLLRTASILLFPLLLVFYVLLCANRNECLSKARKLLIILVIANLSMQILGMFADPRGYSFIKNIITSPITTSYFTDAMRIENAAKWLSGFHTLGLEMHSSTHPPGPVLFYYFWIKMLGPDLGGYTGAHVIGLIGSLSVLTFYFFTGFWTQDTRSRLISSAYYALLPALVLFFPEFDQTYPVFTILLIAFWMKAIQTSYKYALLHGIVLFVSLLFSYSFLMVIPFWVLFGVYFLSRNQWKASSWVALLRAGAISIGVGLLCYVLLNMTTGFHPILSLQHAIATQESLGAGQGRPYFTCIVFDLYDFALGAGILVIPLVVFHLLDLTKHFSWSHPDHSITLIGFATILFVDLSGLLRAETARVWLFLQPLLLVPSALPLRDFGPGELKIFFILQWFIVVLIKSKMLFINA